MSKFKTEKVTELRCSCSKVSRKGDEHRGIKCTCAVWRRDKHIKNIDSDKIVIFD